MKKRRIVITRETDELFVIKIASHSREAWCPQCAASVRMLTPEMTTAVTGLSARTIFRLVEAGQLHFTETPGGVLLICLNSFAHDSAMLDLKPLTKEFSP